MNRNLEYHVLVGAGPGKYYLLDHPEVTVERYYGNASFVGWKVFYNGIAGRNDYERDLDNVDRELLRFRNCEDCGRFDRCEGHPRVRCPKCHPVHEKLKRGFEAGKQAVANVESAWAKAERVRAAASMEDAVAVLLGEVGP